MSSKTMGDTLAELLGAIRRRRWSMLIGAGVVLALTFATALLWPATYRSTATILIEQQEVPTDLVRSTISSYADQRIQVINQRVMTTANLLKIMEKYDLYASERSKDPREVVIARMRDDVQFNMISADVVDPRIGRPTRATIAFAVSYDNRSAETAARVANELTTLYLNENIESRKQLTADTANFLTEESNRLSRTVAELETRIATFKEQNADSLPDLNALNVQMMARVEEEAREVDTRIRSLDQQVVYLDAQLAQLQPAAQIYTSTGERVMSPADRLKTVRSDYLRASSLYAPDHPDVIRLKRELDGLEKEVGSQDSANDLARQLAEARSQLVAARQRYGAEHPDIVRLERLVSSVEAAMRVAPATAVAVTANPDNPAYIQVRAQREASANERASLQQRRGVLAARVAEFEKRLSESPEIEREYSGLVRELESSQLKYREVRQKQMEAQLAQNLESESKGERFTLIEPPIPAQEPVSPNRLAIVVLGVVFAAIVAFASMLLLEVLDTSVRGPRDLERLLSVAPLAIVPWIMTDEDRARVRRQRHYALAGVAGSLLVAVTAAHFLYRPLDVIWHVALRKIGG